MSLSQAPESGTARRGTPWIRPCRLYDRRPGDRRPRRAAPDPSASGSGCWARGL